MGKKDFFKMNASWLTVAIVSTIITASLSQIIDKQNLKEIQGSLRRNTQNASIIRGLTGATDKKLKQDHDVTATNDANKPHSRKKRLIWITDDGRLALPPGTVLTLTPTLSLPLVRYPLEGFLSNMTMSFPLTIDFDKLGLTDNENPLGVLPPIFARKMGRAAGSYLANYIGDYLTSRKARSINEETVNFMTIAESKTPTLPDSHKHAFHGGERAILYGIAEDFLSTFGMDGKACLLRTICEVHSKKSVDHLGFIGEIAKLFFTATKSNYAHLMTEYVRAQQIGEGKVEPGECFPYYKKCPKSIFRGSNKYSDAHANEAAELNEIEDEVIELEESENKMRQTNAAASIFNM